MKQVKFNGETLFANDGELLSDVLMRYGKAVEHPCGGKGICGKCKVTVNGKDELSCRYRVCSDITVTATYADKVYCTDDIDTGKSDSEKLCFALDIGSTTLALALVATDEKRIIKTVTATNPQRIFGADIISRIEYCRNNPQKELQHVLVKEINSMLEQFDTCKADTLYISANTTILHLLLGEDCTGIGVAPYTPAFLEAKSIAAYSIGISGVERIETLPCIAAFMGADIVAGMNYIGEPKDGKFSLLVDLGTNAEIVLIGKNGSVSTSAAAGPCFEGANISCGMSAVNGAVFSYRNGKAQTIGGTEPKGICGSGLIDAAAYMLQKGIMDKTGYMENECFEVAKNVTVTQEDMRRFQLAKSAVRSAIDTLVKYSTITHSDIDTVYISGGFSCATSFESAVRTGLLPDELKEKCQSIGNSSLLGTVKYACEKNDLTALVSKTKYIDLSADAFFSDLFISNIMF